jgi:flagellar biosynthetic protein FliR
VSDGIDILLPFALLLARISGMVATLPVLSFPAVPVVVRVGLALTLTIFMGMHTPVPTGSLHWLGAVVLVGGEVVIGVALGLMVRLVYQAVRQAGAIAAQQMGLTMAQIVDPTSGEQGDPIGTFFDITFLLLFLAAGGHHLLIGLIGRSYSVLPVGQLPEAGVLAEGVTAAGSAMLLLALKLAAPMLAAFLALGVMLALLARVLPEMNILMTSLPLRVGLGFLMAAAMLPLIDTFVTDMGQWINGMMV